MSSNASVNITSLEDTKEVAKQTTFDCDSENETSLGADEFDSKYHSGNFAVLGKTNNNTEEEPGFRNERDDTFQCKLLRQNIADTSTPVDLPQNNHVENIEEDADEGVIEKKSPSNLDINLNQKEDFITDRQAFEPEKSPEAATFAIEKIEIDQDELCPLAENKESNEAELTDSKDSILSFDTSERNEESIEIDQNDEQLDSTAGGETVGDTSQDTNLTDYKDRIEENIEVDLKDDNTSGAEGATDPSLDGKLTYVAGIERKEANSSNIIYGEENANETSKETKSDGAVTEQSEEVNDKGEEENISDTVVLLQDKEKVIQKTVEGDITDGVVPAPAEGNVTKGDKSDSAAAEEELNVDPVDKNPDASLEHTQEYISDIDNNFETLNKTTSDKDLGIGEVGSESESEAKLYTQKNKKDNFDKLSDMGQCFPNSQKSNSSGKPRKNEHTLSDDENERPWRENVQKESKKERGRNACRQLPESHHWSDHDTKMYREGYPNKKDNHKLNQNLKFYQGTMSSSPDGDFIDNIHKNWWGDHDLLERHHGYIQWLFPIRESGMNWHAQELQLHEAEAIQKDEKALDRFITSYEMMLDFYGMKLVDRINGEVQRSEKWKERFHHLNNSMHNYLRITRILKCLGEMGLEHFKKPFIRFVLNEAICTGRLDRTLDSCLNYWVGTLRKDKERKEMEEYIKQLFHKKDDHIEL